MATKRTEFVAAEERIKNVAINLKKVDNTHNPPSLRGMLLFIMRCVQITEQAEAEVRAEFEKIATLIEQRKQHLLHKINSLRITKG